MRILFSSAQLPGHLDWGGYLATAAALAQRGHAARWVSGAAVERQVLTAGVDFQRVEETGWRWPPPPPLASPAQSDPAWQQARMERALDQWLDEARVGAAVEELLAVAAAFEPDLMVTELFVAAAAIVAERLEVPLAVAGWPARQATTSSVDDPLVQVARARLARLLDKAGVSGSNWSNDGPPVLLSSRLHLTYWSPTWYAGVPLAPQTRHAGGIAPEALPPLPGLPDPQAQPWVLITLGTSFNDDPNFFVAAALATEQMGCLPVVVTGDTAQANPAWRQRLPRNAVVLPFVPFAAVLPFCAAAIHHGGAGTTHALVTHGVPQVVVPHAGEQAHQAHGIVRSGVGLPMAPRQVTVARLQQALAEVLPDLADARHRAQALQAEFAALGGIQAAARWIEAAR